MRFPKFWYKVLIILVLSILVAPFDFISTPKKAHAATPANPNASQNARMVLDYFYTLKSRAESGATSDRVISGQQVPQAAFSTLWSDFDHHVIDLYTLTNKWVGIAGSDLNAQPSEVNSIVQRMINYWNNGGLVTFNWHAKNPWTNGAAGDETIILNADTAPGLFTSGTTENANLVSMLDTAATYLTQLRDAGVVVIWRPYHEMNMNDLWYGGDGCESDGSTDCTQKDTTQADYAQLWRYMFNYFSNVKGLNNLLWLYAANNQWSASSIPVDTFYPGSAYVDLVGQDVYEFDNISLKPNANGSCDKLAALGKPMGIAETGPWRNKAYGNWDVTNVISKIKSECARATFFQLWNSWSFTKDAIIDLQNASALMNDPWVVNKGDFSWQPPSKDPNSPLISNIIATASAVSPYMAKVTWATDKSSTTTVRYGISSGNYPNVQQGLSGKSHMALLSGLQPNKTYYYKVSSTDVGGNISESTEKTFTTIGQFPSTTYQVDSQGYIKNWEVLGAFNDYNCACGSISNCDSYFAESTISPSVGDITADKVWLDYATTSSPPKVDLNIFFKGVGKDLSDMWATEADFVTGFAFSYVYSPTNRTVQLRTGSDDGMKAWLNGQVVLDKFNACRGWAADTDITTVNLNAGWNKLLIGISDNKWGFVASTRFTDVSGNPITDLQIAISNPNASQMMISKSADKVSVRPGDNIIYTISWSNPTQQNMTSVKIEDILPAGTTFVSADNGGIINTGKVIWNVGSVNAGASGTVHFTVKTNT